MSGPGHEGYSYNSDEYCVNCGQDVITELFEDGQYKDGESYDTETHPQPIFFGESDCEQNCCSCGEYLYGEDSEDADETEDADAN